MTTVTGAILGAVPYKCEVPVPTSHPSDAPLVCISVNLDWIPYIVGALGALTADSTWDTDDENTLATVKSNVSDLMQLFAAMEACPVPIEFQPNPSRPQDWQYSLDGGVTWLNGPTCAVHYTPTFPTDGGAPSGYDLSVNGGLSSALIPLFTANDPNAVVKDPAALLTNLITAGAGIDGLVIQALAQVGVWLVKNNGVSAAFNKIPGLGAATSVLELVAGTDYTYPLLETVTSP